MVNLNVRSVMLDLLTNRVMDGNEEATASYKTAVRDILNNYEAMTRDAASMESLRINGH